MRKFAILLLSLILCLTALPLSVYASATTGFTLTLMVDGTAQTHSGSSSYILPTADAGEGKTFAGWYAPATDDKAKVFLPAGAAVTEDIATQLTAVFLRMETRADAEIRLTDGDEGVRFVTDINRDDYTLLSTYGTIVSLGTLIVQEVSLLLTNNVLTHEAMGKVTDTRYSKYLDVVTQGSYTETRNTFTIAGSVSQIPSKKLYTEFAGVGYIKMIYSNGAEGYVYADHSTDGETKLYPLAVAAFGDRTDAPDIDHPNKTNAGYSPYEPSQIAFMQTVLDRVINLTFVNKNKAVILPDVKAYNAPFTITTASKNDGWAYIELSVKAGSNYRFDEDFYILLENGKLRYIYDKDTYVYEKDSLCAIDPRAAGKSMAVDFEA